MRVSEFLDKLYATPRTWRYAGHEIVDGQGRCPFLALVWIVKLSKLSGPGACSWDAVFNAADGVPGHDPKIRRALQEACGLSYE